MFSNLRAPPELDITSEQIATKWRTWRREWDIYATATELASKSQAVQIAVFLNCVGRDTQEVASHFTDWSDDQSWTKALAPLVECFEAYCVPRENVVRER